MASPPTEPEPQPDERIASLINEYFDRRRSGQDLTAESFAAEHPDLADQLKPYLEGLSLLDKLRPATEETADVEETAGSESELPAIAGYEVLEEIGRGGMGVVYRALQLSTKRVVALKVILAGPFASQSSRRRFEREVELAARLEHPHIVRVLESGHVAQQQYYAMDYVTGAPLDRWLAEAQPDVPTVLGVFERICQAADYAHRRSVIHRDLKPGNVLIDADGQPHILDFGLGKATDLDDEEGTLADRVSASGQVVGTLPYLSPEQATGTAGDVDGRTDVYTLGALLFEALTGSLPYDISGHPSQVLRRILEEPPIAPSSLSDRVGSELETIILKALEHDRERRYQTAREMAEDVRRYLEGEPILARRPSSLYVLRKKIVKHRLPVSLTAAVVFAAIITVLIVLLVDSWAARQHFALGRQEVLRYQRNLEHDAAGITLGSASKVFERFREVPEATLLWAQAQYRDETTRNGAILLLEREIVSDPTRWYCRALLAEVYRTTGYPERADELQARADNDAPDTAEAWYLRSFATFDQRKALACAEEAVRREPLHILARTRAAHLRAQLGDLDGAIQAADGLIALQEDSSYWLVFKGQVLARQGRFPEAVEQYTRVITTDPKNGFAHLYRAHAYRRLREYELAVADYDALLDIEENETEDAWHLYQRATPLWILGRTEEVLRDYRRARVLLGRPTYADARRFLILWGEGRDDEADTVLSAARRDVSDDWPWLKKIYGCLAGEMAPEALIADAVAENDEEHICEAYYYAAEVCLLADRRAEARRYFELCVQTGVQFDPDTAPAVPMNEFELAQWRLDSLFGAAPEDTDQEN